MGAQPAGVLCDVPRVRVIVTVVAVLLLATLAYADREPPMPAERIAGEGAAGRSADRIETARKQALDDDYQAQLPRYEYDDAIRCATDPNCRLTKDGAGSGSASRTGINPGHERPRRSANGEIGD